jgi:nitronate monooxygenase
MKQPMLKIKKFKPVIPIIQGGMAVKISTGELAGAVALENGIGVVALSGMTEEESIREIKIAKEKSKGNGLIGVNIMVAASTFLSLVEAALSTDVDVIFVGAGFSKEVFKLVQNCGKDVAIVPIVSSAKAAKLSLKLGADAVVVEGVEAGGHLGTDRPMKEILKEVIDEINGDIPVIAAGGILYGKDICEVMKMGASGVQMATRFVMSDECNADIKFKQTYLEYSNKETMKFLSPVGYPGRAVPNDFLKKVEAGEVKDKCKYICLKSCNRRFCIIESLIRAQEGDVENGIIFAGERYNEIKDILPVKLIIKNLLNEIKECLEG